MLASIADRRRKLSVLEMQGNFYELGELQDFVKKHAALLDKEEENVRLLLAST